MGLLYKNHLINNRKADETATIALDKLSLEYEYQYSQVQFKNRELVSKSYINKTPPNILIPFNHKGVRFNMISCPAGDYVRFKKQPRVNYKIEDPFMLGETEVTQELFEAVMGFNYSNCKDSNQNPVEMVTWFDCLEFCNRLSDCFELDHYYELYDKRYETDDKYHLSIVDAKPHFVRIANGFRLPKEWEWQFAYRAGTNNKYAGANDDESLKRVAWFDASSDKKTYPVAQKLPNEWGFYDMTGNVSEWCETPKSLSNNHNHSENRVINGDNSYQDEFLGDELQRLDIASPNYRTESIGFRIAKSI